MQVSGKRNRAGYRSDFVDNRPWAIAQKKQIDSIYAQPFSPFPEGRADKEPMGLAAVRGNALQQQAAPFSGRTGGVPVVQRQPFKRFPQGAALGLADDANAFFGGNLLIIKGIWPERLIGATRLKMRLSRVEK